jgi:hypothetical protein
MRYTEARQILAEAIGQLDEAFKDISDKANRGHYMLNTEFE